MVRDAFAVVRFLALAAVMIAAVSCPVLAEAPTDVPSGLADAVARIFREDDPDRRKELLAGLSEHDAVPLATLRAAIRGARAYTGSAGLSERTVRAAGTEVAFRIQVPREYEAAQSWPLIVSLEGLSTDAGASLTSPVVSGLEGFLVASPELPADDPDWPGYPKFSTCIDVFRAMLDDILRTWNVDPNRVFVTGLSQGGSFAWYLACFRGDRLGGAVAVAGFAPDHPDRPHLINLRNVPFYSIHGVKDRVTPVAVSRRPAAVLKEYGFKTFTYREISDAGHEWPQAEVPKVRSWLKAQRRDPAPTAVRYANGYWQSEPPARFFWVEIRRGGALPVVEAEVRENAIMATTKQVRRVAFLLSEDLVDLSKEVSVTVNGKEAYRGVPARSARLALESFLERWDEGAMVQAVVEVEGE